MKKITLTLVRGIPGSGKSTYVKTNYHCLHLENDMFHIHNGNYEFDTKAQKNAIEWCVSMCETALGNGMDVVVSNTFTKKAFVDAYKKIAEKYDANFEVIRCTGNYQNQHNVPKFVFESMKRGFEDYEGEKFV